MSPRRPWAVLLTAAAIILPAAAADGAVLTAGMSADQVVPTAPAGVPFAAWGRLNATLRVDGRLTWRVNSAGTSGPVTRANLRLGRRGSTGRLVAVLCEPCVGRPRVRTARLPLPFAAAVRAGGAYVELVTAANPGGELRGQVVVAVRSALRQLPSHPPRTETRGVRVLNGVLEGRRLDWDLILQGIDAKVTRAEIRRDAGPVLTLCAPCRTRQTGTWNLSAVENRRLRAGAFTVWVATAVDPDGYSARRIVIG